MWKARLIALVAALVAGPAAAQQYMNLPPFTLVGNMTAFNNPGNAVTIPQLITQLGVVGFVAQGGPLGTPSSGNLANTVGYPVSALTGFGAGVEAALVTAVGTGGAPVLLNGVGGTPSSLTLTHGTGLPVAGLTGLGTGIATILGNNLNASGGIVSPTPTRAGDVLLWNGSTFTTCPGNNSGTQVLQETSSGVCSWVTIAGTSPLPGFLGGLVLSNDSGSPNSVLDIAAGSATDAASTSLIPLGAFTKSTAGVWAAGSGSNGMGNGLSVAAGVWYHVCLTPNGGTSDVWFDTSAACANKPSGVSGSLFRRIGSFKTDGSAHIIPFLQIKDNFYWQTPIEDVIGFAVTSTPTSKTFTVPLGVSVRPILNLNANSSGTLTTSRFRIYSALLPDNNSNTNVNCGASSTVSGATVTAVTAWCSDSNEYTDTSQNLRLVNNANEANVSVNIWTLGWIDGRGQ